ncbi:MAG: hypothetical protein KDB27_22745 [Planctomycetales bacterium]|nr:hypothetical protein [Planctomycetales bacterium]
MARKIKPPDAPPSKAYLVSFGDTMTTLLAFFIVLCSLAENQTGADLHTGTGSFIQALSGGGLPGRFTFDTSANAIVRDASSPLYIDENVDGPESESKATGTDDDDNAVRVINRDKDVYTRYLNELENLAKVERLPEVEGEVVFDIMSRYNPQPPLLNDEYRKAIAKVVPLLRRENHRVEIVVWATMPSSGAWLKASTAAATIHREIHDLTRLTPEQSERLTATGQTWKFADVKRPIVSIIVRKLAEQPTEEAN